MKKQVMSLSALTSDWHNYIIKLLKVKLIKVHFGWQKMYECKTFIEFQEIQVLAE